ELIEELSQALSTIENDDDCKGLILTSSNEKFFSIGFDIPQLYNFSKEEFKLFYSNFNKLCIQLYSFSKPTVAVITGHATAGGCILTLCCDYRFISEGKKLMGLNEIKLGVPIPYPSLLILEKIVGTKKAREIVYRGKFYTPSEQKEIGLVDGIVEPEKLLEHAVNTLTYSEISSLEAFKLIKTDLQKNLVETIKKNLSKHESSFLNAWFKESTRMKLREAIEKY
ncbi:MAG: enoyl-CoA hydratase/isomerase family protein, partial [Candidatus Hodarchaeales archaeon]